jgi:hypothetical protein
MNAPPKRGHAVSVFVCGRSGNRSACSTTGCSGQARVTCDYELGGRKAGQACDRPLCLACRRLVDGRDYCAPHAAMQRTDNEAKGAT